MKRVIMSVLCLAVSMAAVKAQDHKAPIVNAPTAQQAPQTEAVDPNAGVFKFKEETHNYGTVPEGPKAECDFEFTNTGKKPISISNAAGSCGCTVPQWPHEPIMPGKKGVIHVSYNTEGRSGRISKTVTISSDAQQKTMVLSITGDVTPKAAVAKTPETKAN